MINQSHPWILVNGVLHQASPMVRWGHPPVYEVIRLIDGMPLFFNEHIARLKESLKLMAYDIDVSPEKLIGDIIVLAEKNGVTNHNIRIEMGVDDRGDWTCIAFFVTTFYPETAYYTLGITTVTTEIVRHNPHAKVINHDYLAHISKVKLDSGAFEVLIMDEHHKLAEGSKSNLFFVRDGSLYSAKSKDILMGITRLKILEAADKIGVEVKEDDLYLEGVNDYEACFISGTSIHILPIKSIDDINFASATNDVILNLSEAFKKLIKEDIKATRRLYL